MSVVSINKKAEKSINTMMLLMEEDIAFLYDVSLLSISNELLEGVTKLVEVDSSLFKTSVNEIVSCAALINAYKLDIEVALNYFKFNRATEHLHSLWLRDMAGDHVMQ